MGRWLNWVVAVLVLLFLAALFLPAMQSGHGRSRQLQSRSNLRQIGLGLAGYSNRFDHFPPGATSAPDGSPLHGWPTLILSYVDSVELYNTLNFARPWDDPEPTVPGAPSNRIITSTGIGIYRNPGVADVPEAIRSTALGYETNAWIVGGVPPMRLDRITDGTSQTIMAGEVAGEYKPWGSPVHWRDPGLGINKTPSGFGGPFEGGANFLFVDMSVRYLSESMSITTFRKLATPTGGERININDLE